jgi:hypothetical protein
MDLEEWLNQTPTLALKALAEGMPGAHDASKKRVIAFILKDAEATRRARLSKRIEEKALSSTR